MTLSSSNRVRLWSCLVLLTTAVCCGAQPPDLADDSSGLVRIATWNIERFDAMFDQIRQPPRTRDRYEMFDDEEDKLEVQLVFDLERFDPDIVVIQECCDQAMLERFNKVWLDGRYDYIKVFKSNTPGQWVAVMAKPGYEAVELRQYADEVDPVDDAGLRRTKARSYGGGNPLFPRGPGFVKFKTPAGSHLWVGSTHIKSKGGNSYAMTKWRARQIQRLREICFELAEDTPWVYLGGDFNDTFGMDRLEERLGIDAIAGMLDEHDGRNMVSPTHQLKQRKPELATYHAKLKPFDPSFFDHVFLTSALNERLDRARVINQPIAYPASDHLPVVVTVDLRP